MSGRRHLAGLCVLLSISYADASVIDESSEISLAQAIAEEETAAGRVPAPDDDVRSLETHVATAQSENDGKEFPATGNGELRATNSDTNLKGELPKIKGVKTMLYDDVRSLETHVATAQSENDGKEFPATEDGELRATSSDTNLKGELPKIKGVKTMLFALVNMMAYLMVHFLERNLDTDDDKQSLLVEHNRMLAFAVIFLGILASGIGEALHSWSRRAETIEGAIRPKGKGIQGRGRPQILAGVLLFVQAMAAALGLGPFALLPQLMQESLSLFATGLFTWGYLLYMDSLSLETDM